jgi:hypothetical protein
MRASRTTNLASKKAERSLQLVIPTLLRRRGDTSASSAARTNQQPPDLRMDMLMECRSVIVDLGNTCWTSSFQ